MGPPLEISKQELALKELQNCKWRKENQMSNQKYLMKRNFQFFEGSFKHLNRYAVLPQPRPTMANLRIGLKNGRSAGQSIKNINSLMPALKRRKVSE